MTVPQPPNVCPLKNADREVGFHRHIPHNCFCQSFQDTEGKTQSSEVTEMQNYTALYIRCQHCSSFIDVELLLPHHES